MGLFNKLKEPIFLKESSDAEKQLEKMLELEPLLNTEGQAKIRQEIKYICFVIECKNLYGDVEINSAGDFIRTVEVGGKRKKEGIYSPITQNQRHLELMKKVKMDTKNNILTKYMLERCFDDFNKSVVVLANPKTVLNAKYAKKEVKEKVIRADQLISYIKEAYKQSKAVEESDEGLLTWANSYLELHKEIEKDYTGKFESFRMVEKGSLQADPEIAATEEAISANTVSMEDSEIFLELKAYRLAKSREEKIKPYFIYNDNQLRDLITKMPRKKEDLTLVVGFGEVKVNKYGEDILKIIEKY